MFDTLADHRTWLLLCGVLGGWLLILLTNPARTGLRDGWRALRRYPSLWLTLGLLGFCYELFNLGVRVYFHFALPPSQRPEFVWVREAWRDPDLRLGGSPESIWWLPHADLLGCLRAAVLPALENLAGLFNNAVPTFPVAAVAALLLLANWDGHHVVLFHALRKRFGAWGWIVHFGIVLCALAALAKPLLYAAPPLLQLSDDAFGAWFQWSPVVEWLSFLFEYLFGVFVQLYLILLAYVWVRGLNFTHQHLVDFSLRRGSFVLKWAAIVMLLSSLFVNLPLLLKNFAPFAAHLPQDAVAIDRYQNRAHLGLALFLLLTATLQITLTFHSESWRKALRDHARFLVGSMGPFVWFLIIAALHLFALHALNLVIAGGVGEGTALWVAWKLVFPWLAGLVTGWLLAGWVCVFHQCETSRLHTHERIRF